MKISSTKLSELRKKVKEETGYNLKQIDITAFTDEFIDYRVYKDRENDLRIGRNSIDNGRVTL